MKPAKIPELFWQYESLYIPIGRWKNECVEEDLTLLYNPDNISDNMSGYLKAEKRAHLK